MARLTEKELLEGALSRLQSMLPGYEVRPQEFSQDARSDEGAEAVWQFQEPGGVYTDLLVQAKVRFLPRDVDRVLGGLTPKVRQMMRDPAIIIVAPWLSSRTQGLLVDRGLNYLDLTGNVSIRISRPAVIIYTQGADRNPERTPPPPAQLKGSRVNRIVRLLVDVKPPYGVSELARSAEVSPGYVSRVLEALDEQALVQRTRRGQVTDVDWARLLEARAANYDLFSSNEATNYVTQQSIEEVLERLRRRSEDREFVVVTGSVAAAQVAPVTGSAQLVMYANDPQKVRTAVKLLPATRGANVVVLRPADNSQIARPRHIDGIAHVGLSQLVLDCLAGNGRLPEEGDAVLKAMAATEDQWRLPKLSQPSG